MACSWQQIREKREGEGRSQEGRRGGGVASEPGVEGRLRMEEQLQQNICPDFITPIFNCGRLYWTLWKKINH